jgi:hypothetical protein
MSLPELNGPTGIGRTAETRRRWFKGCPATNSCNATDDSRLRILGPGLQRIEALAPAGLQGAQVNLEDKIA